MCLYLPSDTRLFGPLAPREGLVEVFVNGEWGTVCSDSWDDRASSVLCNQLIPGNQGWTVTSPPVSPAVTLPIVLNNVQCTGSELSILDCIHTKTNLNTCDHSKDVYVKCSGE